MRTRQKFLSLVMSIMMMMSILSSTALAEEPEDEIGEEPVICAGYEADENCQAETHVEGCPLYVAPAEPVEEPTEEPTVELEGSVCAGLEGCVYGAAHDVNCPLYPAIKEDGISNGYDLRPLSNESQISGDTRDNDTLTVNITTTGGLQNAVQAALGLSSSEEISEDEKAISKLTITTSENGALGGNSNTVSYGANDSFSTASDFAYLNRLFRTGALKSLDFENARVENNTLPINAFNDIGKGVINSDSIIEIKLSDTVTVIGKTAFHQSPECGGKVHILNLPDSITELCQHAFARVTFDCYFQLPQSLKKINIGSFYGCNYSNGGRIELSGNIEGYNGTEFVSGYIPTVAFFAGYTNEGSVDTPTDKSVTISLQEGIISIDEFAFGCNGTTNAVNKYSGDLVLPASLQTVSSYAFCYQSFDSVIFSDGCTPTFANGTAFSSTKIGTLSFGAHSYQELPKIFPQLRKLDALSFDTDSGIQTIADHAFGGNEINVTSLQFPSTLKKIGATAFQHFSSLNEIDLCNVEEIGNYAFSGSDLSIVVIPETVTQLGHAVFMNNNNMHTIVFESNPVSVSPTLFGTPEETWNSGRTLIAYYYQDQKPFSFLQTNYCSALTNGGTFAANAEFKSGELAAPIKDGFIFDGWYENENCTGTAVTTAETGKIYYAKWIKLESNAISMEYGSAPRKLPTINGVTLTWNSKDENVVTVSDNQIHAVGVGSTTLTAEASTAAGGTATLTVNVEVTPMWITYGKADTTQDDGGIGRPYITYALKEDGSAPTFSELLKFYPVREGSQEGTYEADTDKPKITLTPGMGDDGDVYYVYQNDVSGNIIQTGTLPTHPTTDAEGNPHSIRVELKLKNPNYRFCTVGTNWQPSDTIILYVTCYEEGMNEVDLYLEGDDKPLETFEGDREYEYTGEGIVPTARDLTTLYTKGESTSNTITQFTAHFHAVKEGTAFTGTHLYNQTNSQLTADALKKIAPTELGVYSFVINGYNKNTKTYCYASRRYSIVEGTPQVEFGSVSAGAALSSVPVTVKNAAGAEVAGSFAWENGDQTVERGKSYAWTFTPDDTAHYNTVNGETVLLRTSSGGGSGSGSSSAVSVDSTRNGSVTVSPKSAKKGDAVTITVKPDKGYEVDEIIVTDKNGNELKLAKKSDTKYTFTMPAGKVTVEATFVKVEETLEHSFIDVPDGYWAEDAIAWAYENGCMNGNTAVTFNPNGTVSRQQLWMILARLSGYNPAAMAEAKSWAVDIGISDGTVPGGAVSRQQLVTILYRYAVRMGYQTDRTADLTAYPDHASVAAYAKDAMSWSVANSIVGGTTQGTLNPAGTATRAQFAVILSRFCENIAG